MHDRSEIDAFDAHAPEISMPFPQLPAWLGRRLLQANEEITWVCGPRFNPSWERCVTHPALFIFALALGAACLGAGWLLDEAGFDALMPAALIAAGIVLASIFVLGICSGYFTRLVVTNFRLVILQGYEVCRSWHIDDLPYSLIRYGRPGEGGKASRAVDLNALKTMLGSASDKVAESKTILAFGKQIEQIKAREKGRP